MLQDNVAALVYDNIGAAVLLPDGSQVLRALDDSVSRSFEAQVTGRPGNGWQTSLGLSRTLMHDATGANVCAYIPNTLLGLAGLKGEGQMPGVKEGRST